MSNDPSQKNIATRSVRAGLESDSLHGSVVPPIYLSSNFAFQRFREPRAYDYTRSGNPTRDQLAMALADLEGGAGAVVTCTGLAAITLIVATLPAGARVLAPHGAMAAPTGSLAALHAKGSLIVDFSSIKATTRNCAPRSRQKPQLVWIETPSNPLCCVWSISVAISDAAARAAGAPLSAVDNTFLSPILAATVGARRGFFHALDHQVPERTQRCCRRRRNRRDG